MTQGTNDYVDIVRQLPRPTLAQTERFAGFVSSAHRWYKRLPVHPKSLFVFFLNPWAGMSVIHGPGCGKTRREICTIDGHYANQTTRDYRRRFGYWSYGVWAEIREFEITTDAAGTLSVPAWLAELGAARVSALVHPLPCVSIWGGDLARFGLSDALDVEDPILPPSAHTVLRRVASVVRQEDRSHPRVAELIPPPLRESLHRMNAQKARPGWPVPTASSWDWPSDVWLAELQSACLAPQLISAVVRYVELEQMRALGWGLFGCPRRPPQWPPAAVDAVAEAGFQERARQLVAMSVAMNSFAKAIYSSMPHPS